MLDKLVNLWKNKSFVGDGLRFIIAGGFNTLITFSIYQVSLLVFPHTVSYTISWIIGIGFLVIVYPSRVFPAGVDSFSRRLMAVSSYLIVFATGLWFLTKLVNAGCHPRLAILFVLFISTGLNFIAMRCIFRNLVLKPFQKNI